MGPLCGSDGQVYLRIDNFEVIMRSQLINLLKENVLREGKSSAHGLPGQISLSIING